MKVSNIDCNLFDDIQYDLKLHIIMNRHFDTQYTTLFSDNDGRAIH